ncbi:hypothetical protein, partial [Xylella fastidiosa]|uniref:hypothetical protein n=1 Tax=Xylella fastidiosa TaxID=2371 RepID=UPI001FC7EA25
SLQRVWPELLVVEIQDFRVRENTNYERHKSKKAVDLWTVRYAHRLTSVDNRKTGAHRRKSLPTSSTA